MKKPVVFRRKFWIPIYDVRVHVGIYNKDDALRIDVNRWLGAPKDEPMPAGIGFCCHNGKGTYAVVFKAEWLNHNLLAHELFHLTARILAHWSIDHQPDNHEAEAALNGYLHEVFYKHIGKFIKH